jgi:hypothetical protein
MFANSKITLYNWLVIGLMAITFIVFAKMIFAKWQVPGVSEVVSAA